MERDILGLADDSLFIEKTNQMFKAADADLLIRAHAFSLEKVGEGDAIGENAATLLLEPDADAITVAAAPLAPLLWQKLADPGDIRASFGEAVAASIDDLSDPFNPRTAPYPYQRNNNHALLASTAGVLRKVRLLMTFRLMAVESATDPCQKAVHKISQATLDFLVSIAKRISIGGLQRRLEGACYQVLNPGGSSEW